MDLYREQLLDHYRHPRNWGLKPQAHLQERGYNPLCGDEVTIQLEVKHGAVAAMYFEGHGCVISLASASLLSEHLVGQPVEDVKKMAAADIQALLGVTLQPTRLKCGLLALETLKQALDTIKTC